MDTNIVLQKAANDIIKNYQKINKLLIKFYELYPINNKFYYNDYTIYNNVISVDIKKFNFNFLIFINTVINKSPNINSLLSIMKKSDKSKRVVLFGLLMKELRKNNINISKLMIAYRNLVLYNLIMLIKNSSKLVLYRVNYDDFEFSFIKDIAINDVVKYLKFSNIIKIEHFDYVIVLNRRDGVFYIKNNKLVDIKYCGFELEESDYFVINKIIRFLLTSDYNMKDLNKDIKNIAIMSYNMSGINDIYSNIRNIFSKFVPILSKGIN